VAAFAGGVIEARLLSLCPAVGGGGGTAAAVCWRFAAITDSVEGGPITAADLLLLAVIVSCNLELAIGGGGGAAALPDGGADVVFGFSQATVGAGVGFLPNKRFIRSNMNIP
jgi:hypothetical protein